MMRTVDTRPNTEQPGTYDLLVDGKVEVEAESWPVVENIAHALRFPNTIDHSDPSECEEVAEAIAASMA